MSRNNHGVHENKYRNHTIHTDLATELMEEEEAETRRQEVWFTEVKLEIEGKSVLTLIDTGSEISVIAEHVPVSYTHLDVYKRQSYIHILQYINQYLKH